MLLAAAALTIIIDARTACAFPGLPGVPLPNPADVLKGAAADQVIRAVGPMLQAEAPIISSANAVYATVNAPPGPAFKPVARTPIAARNGLLHLGPGDYALGVATFCMSVHSHSPQANSFRLAPLQGKWADIVAAVHARGTSAGINHSDLQVLSWELQAGMKYQELGPRGQQLADLLIPEDRSRLNESYWEKVQSVWSEAASHVPGAPSIDSALDKLGDVGQAIRDVEYARSQLLGYAGNYEALTRAFAAPAASSPNDVDTTPWSQPQRGVYMRLLNRGNYMGPGTLEIRVTKEAAVARVAMIGHLALGYIAENGAVDVPAGSDVGVPSAAVQPLGIAPLPPAGATPTPTPSASPSCHAPPFGTGKDGVPGGNTHHPFSPQNHPGTDVFAPRDTPVYADVLNAVPVDQLNSSGLFHAAGGLNIPETGDLQLIGGTVTTQPWAGDGDWDYGGIVRLALRYRGDSGNTYTINLDYLHLITPAKHPRNDNHQFIDNKGNPIGPSDYADCMGFGPGITSGTKLSPQDLAKHPLIGFLGATQTSHTHIQASMGGHTFDPQPLLESQ